MFFEELMVGIPSMTVWGLEPFSYVFKAKKQVPNVAFQHPSFESSTRAVVAHPSKKHRGTIIFKQSFGILIWLSSSSSPS